MLGDEALERALDQFAHSIRWVLERKDFNTFWPVGLPRAGTAGASSLLEEVEKPLATAASDTSCRVENPTALMLVYLFAIYGMRSERWPRQRRVSFARNVLSVIARSKASDLMNTTGDYRLMEDFLLFSLADAPWVSALTPDGPARTRLAHRLCGLLWAFGEAAYFCNHRIATERHGPYPSPMPGRLVLVRSAYNFDYGAVWPEVCNVGVALPRRIYVYGEYQAAEARFDLFANPLFQFDVNDAARRIAIVVESCEGVVDAHPEERALLDLCDELMGRIERLTALVAGLSERELCYRFLLIMRKAVTPLMADGDTVAARRSADLRAGDDVRGSLDELVAYHDIRQEV